jgi:hypothetical protein
MCGESKSGCCCDQHGHPHQKSCGCECHDSPKFCPSFWTKSEKIEYLEKMLKKLQDEVVAYEERINALKIE